MNKLDIIWPNKRKYEEESSHDDDKKNEPSSFWHSPQHDKFIKVDNNIIYFHTSIDKESIFTLQLKINELIANFKKQSQPSIDLNCTVTWPPIVLDIFSPGGGVFAAFSFIDFMIRTKRNNPQVTFHTIVTGNTASAGTLISVCGDHRSITKYGYMLIHQMQSGCFGKYNELEDDMTNNKNLMKRIKSIYKDHTSVPPHQLDEILKHDLYWNSKKCLEMGLVDDIIE